MISRNRREKKKRARKQRNLKDKTQKGERRKLNNFFIKFGEK